MPLAEAGFALTRSVDVSVNLGVDPRKSDQVVRGSTVLPHGLGKTVRVAISLTSDKPAPISEKEAEGIVQRVQEGVDKPRPKVLFEPGELVRVVDGPFNDFNGVVEQVNYEKSRLQVAVQILGRSTPVELDFAQVEKA